MVIQDKIRAWVAAIKAWWNKHVMEYDGRVNPPVNTFKAPQSVSEPIFQEVPAVETKTKAKTKARKGRKSATSKRKPITRQSTKKNRK